jgi:enoyl-CoA hydratase
MSTVVRYALERAIATITLDSPGNRNALSAQLVAELAAHLDTAAADERARAVVLTHTGSTFCAGADLREQAAEGGPEQGTKRVIALLRQIVTLAKPVIARIDGHVRAGGLGIVGACDIAIAGSNASFAFTEVRLGLAPAMISLTTLGRMSERSAARYYLTGETFDAGVAERSGLITRAADDLDGEIDAIRAALRKASPQGLAETKPVTNAQVLRRFEDAADAMQQLSARLFGSEEVREGIMAFLEKRPARWVVE